MIRGTIILLLGFAALQAMAGPVQDRLILLNVAQSANPWADNRLEEKIITALTREPGWQVEAIRLTERTESGRGRWVATDSIVSLGRDKGGQYFVMLVVTEQRLERRKSFHVPLVFHKWEAVAVIEGEYRIVDLMRGKQVKAEPFTCEVHGPRVIQATMDDTKFDPDITLNATEKTLIFDELEKKLVEKLIPRIKPVLAKGDRETFARQEAKKRP